MRNFQFITTFGVIQWLRVTNRSHHPATICILYNLTIFITHCFGFPKVCGTKRRHRTTVDQFFHRITVGVISSQDTTVIANVTIPMAINRNNSVVWKFITDARVGAHGSCVVDLLIIGWMGGTCQCSVPLWKLSRCDLNDLKIWFSFLDMCDTIIHVLTFFNCDELELSGLPVLKYYIKGFHFA